MNITTTKKDLLAALKRISPAIANGKGALPILSCVHLRIQTDGAQCTGTLTATNFDLTITTAAPIVADEPGALAIPAKRLQTFLTALPADDSSDISLTYDAKAQILTISTINNAGDGSTARILCMDPAEFPAPPAEPWEHADELTIPEKDLHHILSLTIAAASTEQERYVLTGVHFHWHVGTLTAESTDGRRALRIQRPCQGTPGEASVILPTAAAAAALPLLSGDTPASFRSRVTTFQITTAQAVLTGRFIEGKFPDIEKVIPQKKGATTHTLSRPIFCEMIARASSMEREPTLKIHLSSAGTLTTEWTCADVGERRETQHATTSPKDAIFSVNAHFLAPLALATPDTITLLTTSSKDPMTFLSPADYLTYVVMPMRVEP